MNPNRVFHPLISSSGQVRLEKSQIMEAVRMIEQQTLSLDEVQAEETYVDCHFSYSSEVLRFDGVTFKNCQFEQSDFSHSEWTDCRFINCQFLNNDFSDSFFFRTEFEKCQLMGTNFADNSWKKVKIIDSKADYFNVSGSKLADCRLVAVGLHEAYFQEVKITGGLVFEKCDLSGSDFLQTRLKNVDFSSSYFETLLLSVDKLKGCIISPMQAQILVGILGVKVK